MPDLDRSHSSHSGVPHRLDTSWIEALAAKHGHTLQTLATLPKAEGPTFSTHQQFMDSWPQYKVDAEPCDGTLRVEDKFAGKLALRCDECRFEVSVEQGDWQPNPSEVAAAVNLPPDENPVERLLKVANLPAQFLSRPFTPTPDNRQALTAVRDWLNDGAGLPAPAFHGPTGTGKTHMATRLGLQLVQSHRRCLFLSASQWLEDMQAAMNTDYDRIFRRAASAPILILDDLGAERATEWRTERIALLVSARYDRELPLVLTTNICPEDWGEAFEARTASRLQGMTFGVEMQGVDWRNQQRSAA